MKHYRYKTLWTLLFICFTSLEAIEIVKESGSKTHNEVDDGYQAEEGWRFYNDKNTSTKKQEESTSIKDADNPALALLAELLKESKKQTKLQTEIRDLIKEYLDPQPELMVKKDGTTCIANSSADCFKMPLTPEAKRVPVMKDWLEKGDEESATKMLQWQATYFKQIFGRSHALQYAVLNQGTEAYPMDYWKPEFAPIGGGRMAMKEKMDFKNLENNADKFDYIVFLGNNTDLDIFSMDSFGLLVTSMPKNKFHFVFSSEGAMKLYQEGSEAIPPLKKAWSSPMISKTVDPKLFQEYKIYTTPTVVVRHMENKQLKTQAISIGRASPADIAEKTVSYFRDTGVLTYEQDVGHAVWQEAGDSASDHLWKQYRLNLDQSKVKELMKK